MVLAIVVTMGLAGIWHGAGAQFVVLGWLHAVYLTVDHAWPIAQLHHPYGAVSRTMVHLASVLPTYLCVLVRAVFFRARRAHGAGDDREYDRRAWDRSGIPYAQSAHIAPGKHRRFIAGP
ncbi:MAG TPA: hypothetical protein VK726_21365 [Acetobacteraceae bacterium]|nr:hypothetical protein [Acetobacteraceae bacterium]